MEEKSSLREFSDLARGATMRFDSLIAPGYRRAVYSRDGEGTAGVALAVYSKLRILASGAVDCVNDVDTTRATAVWADLRLDRDTVRVFCNHLRSTHIKSSDSDYLMNYRFLTDTASHEKLHSILSRLRYNSISRSHQVDSLSQLIAATPHARIVCGDFNDTPLSYTYRLMSRGLQDAFREKGRGFSHTYRGFYNTFRIDYVLVSDDFEVLSYEVPSVEFSDHHPVFVRLKYNSQRQ